MPEPGTENNQSIKYFSRRNIVSFLRKIFGFLIDKSFLKVLDVITQHTSNVDPGKGLIHRCIKATSISHMSTQSSQDLESIS
jgi:hypothetical protein